LKAEGANCRLTIEHFDLPTDMSEGVADGWARTLAGLKSWIETGKKTAFSNPDMAQ